MERRAGIDDTVGPWEAFALAAIAGLGPFSQVHLAPQIPPNLLNNAILTYLSLERDELLLAVIDARGKPEGCCALTTRRIYWEELEDAEKDSTPESTPAAPSSGTGGSLLIRRAARYAGLPETILARETANGSFRLELGGEGALVLPGVDARLGGALARYLERMGRTARAGATPSLSEVDPILAARIPGVLRAVAGVTAQARDFSRELIQFRTALHAATPRVATTPLFVAVCVTMFVIMVVRGVPVVWPSGTELIGWGALHGPRILLRHEYWRLLTCVFVHGGLIHLAVNMWSLLAIGPLVERFYGNLAFAVLYLAAGVGGSIASVATHPQRIGVGASGAICGVLGALVAFLITHRRSIPASLLKSLRANVVGIIVFMAVLGMVPNIDQEAHLGGLATGFVCGLLLYRSWPVGRSKWVAVRRGLAFAVIAAATAGAGLALARRTGRSLPPVVRFQDIMQQTTAAFEEFDVLYDATPGSLAMRRDRSDPEARQGHLQNIGVLLERASRNLARLRRTTTPDPALGTMIDSLQKAQSTQLEGLEAARQYLESGDDNALSGPGGFRDKIAEARRSRELSKQQITQYMIDNKLVQYKIAPER